MLLNLPLERRGTVADERTEIALSYDLDLLAKVDSSWEAHYDHLQLTFAQENLLLVLMLEVLTHYTSAKRVVHQYSIPGIEDCA
jgi:hypothetical protein